MSDETIERLSNAVESLKNQVHQYWLRVAVFIVVVYHAMLVTNWQVEVARSREATQENTRVEIENGKKFDAALKLLNEVRNEWNQKNQPTKPLNTQKERLSK